MNIVLRILSVVFTVFWVLFVFLDYWQKHPVYFHSFRLFGHWGLAAMLVLLGAGVVWSVLKFGKQKKYQGVFNGLSLFVLFLFISVSSVGFVFREVVENASYDLPKAVHVFSNVAGSALATYFITLSCFVLGNLLNEKIKVKVKKEDQVVLDIAAGIGGMVLFLFLLGAVSFLHSFVIFPLLIGLLVYRWKKALAFLKMTLLQPLVTDKKLNVVGTAGFFLLVTVLSFNFTALQMPMPPGFDTLTLYANLPSLIGQHHALVEGFQPYNWSVFMALGHILFDSLSVSLALSYLGGLLALYAMFVVGRGWLNLDVNTALIAVLAFSLIPNFSGQMFAELKIDLGLLYIYLCIVLLLLNYFVNAKNSSVKETSRLKSWLFHSPELLLMGLLTGFSLGTKLTTVYFAFALICALWYRWAAVRGFFAVFLISLFLVFLLKIDNTAGLRQYHIGVDTLKWGVLLAGLLLVAGIYTDNKKALLESVRTTALFGVFFLLSFSPWMVKNYVDTGSLNPTQLMSGKEASPDINLQILEQNWQRKGQ